MYENHFQLRERPFTMLPDPSFIYWGERYTLAYSMLEYGVLNNLGITVVTGEVGCGKTTLVRHLLNQIGDDVSVGLLSNTHSASDELMRWVMMAFGQPFEQSSAVAAFRDFQEFVIAQYAGGRRSLLIVDEAQNLSIAALEELRMLSNINADKETLLQIVLTGQPQLRDILRRPELEQFAQRVASDFHVEPLDVADAHRYILHRLKQAGSPTKLFSHKAREIVAHASLGVPRIINMLCDTALVYGYARGARHISSPIVEAVVADKRKYGVFSFGQEVTASGSKPVPLSSVLETVQSSMMDLPPGTAATNRGLRLAEQIRKPRR